MKKLFFIAFCALTLGCGAVMDGLLESTHDEVDKIGL